MADMESMQEGQEATVLDTAEVTRIVREWRDRIAAVVRPGEPWALVGIKRRGAVLARRLWEDLKSRVPDLKLGEVDISLYRDDYHLQHSQPHVLGTEIAFTVDHSRILLVDDVIYTGRTVRAAIELILDFGRPRSIQLAALIDRGHRELPIAPDFIGIEVATKREDRVQVKLREIDGQDAVLLVDGGFSGAV